MTKPAHGFADRLAQALEYRDMSEVTLGKHIGVSQQAVNNWKQEKNGSKSIFQAANVLGVNPQWLYEGIGEMLPKDSEFSDAKKELIDLIAGMDDDEVERLRAISRLVKGS